MSLEPIIADTGEVGYFQIIATMPDGEQIDITFFRDVPTQVSAFTFSDPFGDESFSFMLPKATYFDRFGDGDLNWLIRGTDIEVRWRAPSTIYETSTAAIAARQDWLWEGFIASVTPGNPGTGTTVECKGALYQLDDFVAIPQNPARPIPYEVLMRHAFDPARRPSLRTRPLQVRYPAEWSNTVPQYASNESYLQPIGLNVGQKWTGLSSRNTGNWDPTLTGFVQSLLATMYTGDGGQWTIIKEKNRSPVLTVRDLRPHVTSQTLYIGLGLPGVEPQLTQDYSQTANVIYGTGTDPAGVAYSNLQPLNSADLNTIYSPFAFTPQVHPASESNPAYERARMRKEIYLNFQEGLTTDQATNVAQQHLMRFSDPGWSGSLTLTSDPRMDGNTFSRFLIRAGMTIVLEGLGGSDVLFHISSVSVDLNNQSVDLTIDTKCRDQLTIEEVQARTRDAMNIKRMLQVNGLQLPFEDYLKPWSYERGSGVIPSGDVYDARPLFKSLIPNGTAFPWTEYTKKYPPKDPRYVKYYIPLGNASTVAADNWAYESGYESDNRLIVPVVMAERGTIRLIQLAAYDEDGNVMPVRFHVSFYSAQKPIGEMPAIPAGVAAPYPENAPYPFFPGAFEQRNRDGSKKSEESSTAPESLVIGWGNFYQPAGYSPGLYTSGSPKTGMLIDESTWSFDTSGNLVWDQFVPANNMADTSLGRLYISIYCDDQGTKPVYFLGRVFRQEPGTNT